MKYYLPAVAVMAGFLFSANDRTAAVAAITTVGQWDLDGNGSLETIKLDTQTAGKVWSVTGSETYEIGFATATQASLAVRQMDAGAGQELVFRYQSPTNSSSRFIGIVALQNDPNKIETIGHSSSQTVAYHNLDGGASDEILLARTSYGLFASYSFRTKSAVSHIFKDTGSGFATTANYMDKFLVGKFKAGGANELALVRFAFHRESVPGLDGQCYGNWANGLVEMWDVATNTTRTYTFPGPGNYAPYKGTYHYDPIAIDDGNASDDLEVKQQFRSTCSDPNHVPYGPRYNQIAIIDDQAQTISLSKTFFP